MPSTSLLRHWLRAAQVVLALLVLNPAGLRAEVATDPMGVNRSDIFVMLNPKSEWTRFDDKEKLVIMALNGKIHR